MAISIHSTPYRAPSGRTRADATSARRRSVGVGGGWLGLVVLLLLLGSAPPAPAAEESCLVNFGERRCGPFKLLPGVIVKAALSKEQLIRRLGGPVTQLAMLDGANLFLVPSTDPAADAERLARQAGVLYAQPDVVQPRAPQGYPYDLGGAAATLPEEWLASRGAGVKVALIDDGFNLEHEDLRGVEVGFSYDADRKRLGAAPHQRLDRHGTRVAGILFARHNAIGIDGVAPDATLIAIRQASTRTSDTVLSFTVAELAGADVINCSWNSRVLMEPVHDVIEQLARHGRGGLGTAILFAAGNEGETLLPGSREAAMESVIAVGSLGPGGGLAPYSNRGEAVDLYLPGRLRTTRERGGYGPFDGTSASTALASGLAALLLARQPRLTLPELRARLSAGIAEAWPAPERGEGLPRGGA